MKPWFSTGLVGGGLAAGILVTMTGCLPVDNFYGEVAIRDSDGQLEVAICEQVLTTNLLVEIRNPGGEWITILDAYGEATLLAGTTFMPAKPPAGLVDSASRVYRLEKGVQVNVLAVSPAPDVTAYFNAGDSGLPTDQWLHTDSSTTDLPCQ